MAPSGTSTPGHPWALRRPPAVPARPPRSRGHGQGRAGAELPDHRLLPVRLQPLPQVLHVLGAPVGAQPVEEFDRLQARAARLLDLPLLHLRSEEHTSELQSRENLVCRLLLEEKKKPIPGY